MNKVSAKAALSAVFIAAFCSGCAAVPLEGAIAAKSEVVIAKNMVAAENGNAEAQYKVGDAHCCSINEGSGIYNTQKAVDWLCRSAQQGYSPAMFRLGKILTGDVFDGPRVVARVSFGVYDMFNKATTNVPIAMAWLMQARDAGEEGAKERVDEVWADMTAADQLSAENYYALRLNAPCSWGDVSGTG